MHETARWHLYANVHLKLQFIQIPERVAIRVFFVPNLGLAIHVELPHKSRVWKLNMYHFSCLP
jgi:hypothetical protein